jgi:4-hydroxybenzoyl-CoA thioesterase/acyl-CoA thioester hydrolase
MSGGFCCRRRVEFRDTDAAGIAHFSVFFVWMEESEHEALRHLGMSVMEAGVDYSWPRVSAQCDYKSPLFFEEELEIWVRVAKLGKKSVTYEFDFQCGDRQVAVGRLTTVCCLLGGERILTPMAIPADVAERLGRLG